jgi:phosphohistidine phosphatase SixA
MGSLFLIRHAQASYGQADYDRLSPRGVQQAQSLAVPVAALRLDQLYRGPHLRHQQTAEHAGFGGATVLEELAEYPAFAMIQHFMPRLVEEDARFAELTKSPSRELANAAFRTVLGRWMRDEPRGKSEN